MAEASNISWTDATANGWWGCTNISLGCDNCYAETLNNNPRFGGTQQWGPGAPRRKIKSAVALIRKLNRGADAWFAAHGRRRRVFMQSMSDTFDNEVDATWRRELLDEAEMADGLNFQMLTKRGPNVPKMVPVHWTRGAWPKHIGLMFTVVTQEEFDRDVPRLRRMKNEFGIPWVGLSIEPMLEEIDGRYPKGIFPNGAPMCCGGQECGCMGLPTDPPALWGIDWLIVGCESGKNRRQFNLDWARTLLDACEAAGTSFFLKQIPGPGNGVITDKSHFPHDLQIQQFPELLR